MYTAFGGGKKFLFSVGEKSNSFFSVGEKISVFFLVLGEKKEVF